MQITYFRFARQHANLVWPVFFAIGNRGFRFALNILFILSEKFLRSLGVLSLISARNVSYSVIFQKNIVFLLGIDLNIETFG